MAETEKKLTAKERRFAEFYLSNGFNGTEAAASAEYKGNRVTLASVAYENLRKPHIRAYINARMDELAMPANEVLARLTEHARGDLGNFIAVPYEDLATHQQSRLLKKVKRTTTTRRNERSGEETEVVKDELELYSAQAALEILARIHGLLKTDITISISVELVNQTVGALQEAGIDASEFFQKAIERAQQRKNSGG